MARNAIHYIDGVWHTGEPRIAGPMTHSLWMGSSVFDGARAFGGRAPDLDRHCARAIASARAFAMTPPVDAAALERLAWDGIARFAPDAELYIRPLFYFEDGFVTPDVGSTRFVLSLFEAPMPRWGGRSACLSRYRRPSPESAPTEAKAGCLYPIVARTMTEARERGFDTALVLDPLGNLAEFSTNNLFLVRGGVVRTPAANGSFLAGLTRRRVIELLRADGLAVEEATLTLADLDAADEVFMTGNYAKILPVTRVEQRRYPPGPVAERARALYFAFAERAGRRTG